MAVPMQPPNTGGQIKCPSCGHCIDWHGPTRPRRCCSDRDCTCLWSVNDIAYEAVFGGLTAISTGPQRVVRQPDGSWTGTEDWA
jgi:hypothetical protein